MARSARLFSLAAFLLVFPVWAQTSEQEAGDVSEIDRDAVGPLKERIPPVSGHYFLHQGRFELTPSVGLTVKDAFFSKYILGGTLTYHVTENFGVVLRGGYSLVTVSGAAQKCVFPSGSNSATPVCGPPTFEELDGRAPGQILALGGVDLEWTPLYGKIALIAEKFVHFDLYGVLGPTGVYYAGPRPPQPSGSTSGPPDAPTWTVGGNAGIGMRFFVNHWMTLRAEFRDVVYQESTSTTTSSLRNQLLFDVGISFFFPTSFEEG